MGLAFIYRQIKKIKIMPKKVEQGQYSKRFPQVAKILGLYFHEDMFDGYEWKNITPNYRSVIRYIKSVQTEATLSEKISELNEFLILSRAWNEDKLSEVLGEDFSCMFYAPFFKLSYREFLKEILNILEEPMEKTKSEFIPKFIG